MNAASLDLTRPRRRRGRGATARHGARGFHRCRGASRLQTPHAQADEGEKGRRLKRVPSQSAPPTPAQSPPPACAQNDGDGAGARLHWNGASEKLCTPVRARGRCTVAGPPRRYRPAHHSSSRRSWLPLPVGFSRTRPARRARSRSHGAQERPHTHSPPSPPRLHTAAGWRGLHTAAGWRGLLAAAGSRRADRRRDWRAGYLSPLHHPSELSTKEK